MLKPGDKAPDFKLDADSGETVSLKDFKGKKVVLYFYPKDMTSGCTAEACDFRDSIKKFEKKNTVVIGVSADNSESHIKFKGKYNLPFTLLSDESKKVLHSYGVWQEKSMYGRKYMGIARTTFVIDEHGKIEKVYQKVKVPGHIDEILNDL
ncbi:MAG: thioredoxin-dependent thiol peroxidase [Chlorobi bacterium]|nr:thioredoxin-dependent thiol peroxidase [Chlorobiota bacterium]MCI0716134.1 thioredoxin-dependent thiol peroxidase [Chlorobiota bacterium]